MTTGRIFGKLKNALLTAEAECNFRRISNGDERVDNDGQKAELIERILKNKTYLPGSGLVSELRVALRKMSVANLQALEVVIFCK